MRILIDTNVIISAALFKGGTMSEFLREAILYHDIFLADYTIVELKNVVKRKFPKQTKEMDDFLRVFPFEIVYASEEIEEDKIPYIRDRCDYPIFIASLEADVDVLVTGDKDFSDVAIERPQILTPQQFLSKYKK